MDTTIQDNGSWTFGGHTFRSATPTGRPICAAPSSSRPMCTTTCWPMTWAWTRSTTTSRPWALAGQTGIDLEGEGRGVLPSTEWKRNTYKRPEHKKWYAGETISPGHWPGLQPLHHGAAGVCHGHAGQPRHSAHTRIWARARSTPSSRQFKPLYREEGTSMGYKPEHMEAVRSALAAVTVEGTVGALCSVAHPTPRRVKPVRPRR